MESMTFSRQSFESQGELGFGQALWPHDGACALHEKAPDPVTAFCTSQGLRQHSWGSPPGTCSTRVASQAAFSLPVDVLKI